MTRLDLRSDRSATALVGSRRLVRSPGESLTSLVQRALAGPPPTTDLPWADWGDLDDDLRILEGVDRG